jgi:hypothetical protein
MDKKNLKNRSNFYDPTVSKIETSVQIFGQLLKTIKRLKQVGSAFE